MKVLGWLTIVIVLVLSGIAIAKFGWFDALLNWISGFVK